jgi:hypothetical protein
MNRIRKWWTERVGFRKTLLKELEEAHATLDEIMRLYQNLGSVDAQQSRQAQLKDEEIGRLRREVLTERGKYEHAQQLWNMSRRENATLQADLDAIRDRLVEFRNSTANAETAA